jgi:hypothetical protein
MADSLDSFLMALASKHSITCSLLLSQLQKLHSIKMSSCGGDTLPWLSEIMKDSMRYLYLLGDLDNDFIDCWCNDDDRSLSTKPKITITDSYYHINKAKFEAIFHFLTMCSHHQSDRSIPRTPFKNGVTDLM